MQSPQLQLRHVLCCVMHVCAACCGAASGGAWIIGGLAPTSPVAKAVPFGAGLHLALVSQPALLDLAGP